MNGMVPSSERKPTTVRSCVFSVFGVILLTVLIFLSVANTYPDLLTGHSSVKWFGRFQSGQFLFADAENENQNQILLTDLEENENQNHTVTNSSNESLLILDWTSFFGTPMTRKNQSKKHWSQDKCPEKCTVTTDRKQLTKAAAVLFHARNLIRSKMPKTRAGWQSFVFFDMESPHHTPPLTWISKNYFNLTMTYRTDSDVWWPYMKYVNKTVQNKTTDEEFLAIAKKKHKLAAWFVSNCGTPSKREVFVKELQKHLPNGSVDIFGGCGPKKCPYRTEKCEKMLSSDYKFYLALENSVCNQYVTEKFFVRVTHNVVPVVFRQKDYREVGIPEDSYIAINTFPNASQLAKTLLYLNSHLEEYIKYFRWQNYGAIVDRNFPDRPSGFCELCRQLHKLKDGKQKRKFTENIHEWWHTLGQCKPNYGLEVFRGK